MLCQIDPGPGSKKCQHDEYQSHHFITGDQGQETKHGKGRRGMTGREAASPVNGDPFYGVDDGWIFEVFNGSGSVEIMFGCLYQDRYEQEYTTCIQEHPVLAQCQDHHQHNGKGDTIANIGETGHEHIGPMRVKAVDSQK